MRTRSVEKASNPAGPAVTAAVRALLAVPPAPHLGVQGQLDELGQLFDVLLNQHHECVFTVRGLGLLVDGERWEETDLASALSIKLRRRLIRRLTIRTGMTRNELLDLVALLSTDHQELLREGGLDAFVRSPTPHIGVEMLAVGAGFGEGFSLPANVADALEDCFTSPETLASLEQLRDSFIDLGGEDGSGIFDQLVSGCFARPEWNDVPAKRIRESFQAFLGMVTQAVLGCSADTVEARLRNILESVRDVTPGDLLKGTETHGAEGSASQNTDSFQDPQENSLLILCELMVSSEKRPEYRTRRAAFLAAFSDQRFSSAAIARILGYIAIDLPAPRFEHRDNLVSDVLDRTKDEEALVLFLCSMTKQPDVARPILSRLIMRPSPFALLVRLVRAPLLKPFRRLLCDKFLEAGRLKHDALVRWAREDSEGLLLPEVFQALLSRPELMGPICKDILTDGSEQDRGRLIERLETEGNETALRLLVLGMPYNDKPCDQRLLQALASFRHPLAVSTLREVIHRNNLHGVRTGEVSTAFLSLNRIGMEKGCAFLREVVKRRALMLPLYRRKLRRIATMILEGKEVPILE